MESPSGQVVGSVESDGEIELERSLVGMVRGRDVEIVQSLVGAAATKGELSVHQAGCGPVISGGGVRIHQGGCGPMIANGDVSIEQGGTQSIIAAGGATLGKQSFVGLVVAPSVTVEDGARVLMNTPQALAAGAVFGVVFAVLSRLFRR